MLALLDGLKARGLLDRARELAVGQCRIELVPPTPDPEKTTKQAEIEELRRQRELEELTYGSS